MTSLLRAERLSVQFATPTGPAHALDDFSFHLDRGEFVGLVGESGCGKSVTALAIMGLLPGRAAQVSGQLFWHDEDLLTLGEKAHRRLRGRAMAMIFQDPMTSLNPVFTVGDQLIEVPRRHMGASRDQAKTQALTMLDAVGLPDPPAIYRAYPSQLSGGQRQRVMIAMAMIAQPELLIADEPTTALDVTTQAQILQLLDRLRRDTGATVLLITHDLGVVAEVCQRVLVLYAGRMAESASVEALFASPRHPYSQGLLQALRKLADGGVEAAIPGRVEPATAYPPGCRFHPRCPQAMPVCRTDVPPARMIESGEVACWLHETGRLS